MNNTNNNVEISSTNSPAPGPSNVSESSTSECTIVNTNATSNKNLITKVTTYSTSTIKQQENISNGNVNAEIISSPTTEEPILDSVTNENARTENDNPQTTIAYHTIASFPEQPYEIPGVSSEQSPSSTRNANHRSCCHNTVNALKAQRYSRSICEHAEPEISISPPAFTPHVIQGPPPLAGAPPSYSAIMRLGPLEQQPGFIGRPIRIQPSPPFIAPIPPPSYAEVQGYHVDRQLLVASVDQMVWGPDPLSVVCPRCAHVVLTDTQSQRSNLTHFSALALCFCGCWPCCLLPYCMDSCKNTYHNCPNCQQFLGMYRPW